jgi:glycosyltransferase involved in cell wall biosynthesis
MAMRILLIGALNLHQQPRGGEEYKNQLLHAYLKKTYSLSVVDTHNWKKKPIIVINLVVQLFTKKWDNVIISASSHSVYRLVQLIQYFPTLASKTLYFVIGGYFPSAIEKGVFRKKPYEKIKALVVQGNSMKNTLLKACLMNKVYVVSNFKLYPRNVTYKNQNENKFKFVFLSRVHPDKGVGEIAEAVQLLNKWGITEFYIVFFGPIETFYKDQFESICSERIQYGGVLDIMKDTRKAYETLASFDSMLFPTYWRGEGFPGALVDAFVAGLPIIASDWNMNNEIIEHEYNGLLIPPKNPNALAEAMLRLMEDIPLRIKLAENSKACAERYHIDNIWPKIKEIIES